MQTLIKELEPYLVKDILDKDIKYIFVLESPHTNEIIEGVPVVGKSGKDMSNILFQNNKPFGLLIKKDKSKKIGIMNISNIPLQLSAYSCDVINLESCKKIRLMEFIRKNPKQRKRNYKDYQKEEINDLIFKMVDDFKNRIQKIDNYTNKKYILCGNFVQEIFKSLDMSLDTIDIPHPSFNNWNKNENKEKINKLKIYLGLE